MKILQRLRPRRPVKTVVAAMLGVLSIAGATLGFSGIASAALAQTPISYGGVGTAIGLLPSGTSAAGNPDAIARGATNQPGASWTFSLSDTGTDVTGTTEPIWASGDVIEIPVFPAGGALNNVTTGAWVEFAGTPIVACSGGGAGATQPTFAVTTVNNPNDPVGSSALTDVLKITITDSPILTSPAPFNCAIIGVTYSSGAATPVGAVVFSNSATDTATYTQGAVSVVSLLGGSGPAGQNQLFPLSNATVVGLTVTANVPPVSVLPNAIDAPISPITLTESIPGTIPVGFICVTASQALGTNGFVISATAPTFTLTPSNEGGAGTVSSTVFGLTMNANGSFQTIVSQVLAASTTTPSTYTFSNLFVDAPPNSGNVTVTILIGATATCTGGTAVTIQGNPDFAPLTIYAVGQPTANTRIFGSTSEQTAVAALEYQYPPTPGFCIDQGVHPNPSRFSTGSSVVLATSGSWQDALTASYLASYLGTGVLLTPTGSLSPYAAMAIQNEGVNNVFIVGGPLAVSQSVENTLASTPAYLCGGSSPQVNALGTPLDLNVQRIDGPAADDTAEAVATYVNSGFVANLNISGDFGRYNDTSGTDSGSSPTIAVRTAILATDGFFQDATSASSLSYFLGIPILLTPTGALGTQAETGLLDLGIQQVIEPGGPLAISNNVNASLISQGISVLRIAGADGSETSTQMAKFELSSYHGLGLSRAGSCTTVPANPLLGGTIVSYQTGCSTIAALARGDFFADALTSSVVTGGGGFGAFNSQFEPIILAESPGNLGQYATAFFNAAGSPYGIDPQIQGLNPIPGSGVTVSSITVFGGPLAIANSTLQAALNAIAAG